MMTFSEDAVYLPNYVNNTGSTFMQHTALSSEKDLATVQKIMKFGHAVFEICERQTYTVAYI